jgi:glycerophosphoryl diester phosphodiesterase
MNSELRSALLVASMTAIGPACEPLTSSVDRPQFADGGLLRGSSEVPAASRTRLRGLYPVTQGGDRFGDIVAIHTTGDAVSIFAADNTAYAVLRAGCIENGQKLVLEGYYRYAIRNDTGLVRLFVGPDPLAAALCRGDAPTPFETAPTLSGLVGKNSDPPDAPAAFVYQEPLRVSPDRNTFVIAHRGGCRTIDSCGASENSTEVIRMAESLGALGVEIDVRLTADGVPVLFHDEELGPRLASGEYCHGSIADFTLAHLRALCTLTYGEPIPTLDDALEAAVHETTLRAVWLDVKTAAAVVPAAEAAARFSQTARAIAHPMRIVIGLGDSTLVDAWIRDGLVGKAVPCLAEESIDEVHRGGCSVWAPRWTLGPMHDEVAAVQAEGRAVAFWTLDEVEFVDMFLQQSTPNAILTNRPGLVFQRVQLLGQERPSEVEP